MAEAQIQKADEQGSGKKKKSKWVKGLLTTLVSLGLVSFSVFSYAQKSDSAISNSIATLVTDSFSIISIVVNTSDDASKEESQGDSVGEETDGTQDGNSALSPSPFSSTCFNQGSAVPCATPHTVEIMPASFSCDLGGFKEFIAAQSTDIISPDIEFNEVQGNCEIVFPYSISISVNSLWKIDSKLEHNLRACYYGDNRDQPIIGCHEKHQGEVVSELSGAEGFREQLNCDQAANAYMGIKSKRKWEQTLIAEPIETSGKWQCIARTRDESQLETPLKDIGTTQISTRPWG